MNKLYCSRCQLEHKRVAYCNFTSMYNNFFLCVKCWKIEFNKISEKEKKLYV